MKWLQDKLVKHVPAPELPPVSNTRPVLETEQRERAALSRRTDKLERMLDDYRRQDSHRDGDT